MTDYILYRFLRQWLLVVCTLLVFLPVRGQIFNYVPFSTEEGLPSSEVYQVYQDSKMYIWILTDNGLARFNGYEMEVFTTEDGLPSDVVFRVNEDKNGRIWFVTGGNKLCYFAENTFHLFAEEVNIDSTLSRRVPTGIFFEGENILIAGANGRSILLDPSGKVSYPYHPEDASIYFSLLGDEVVGARTFSKKSTHPAWRNIFEESVRLDLPLVDTLFPIKAGGWGYPWYCGDGKNVFAFAYVDDVYLFSQRAGHHSFNVATRVNQLFWDGKNAVWVSTRDGLIRCHFESGEIEMDTIKLPSHLISGTWRDREGGHWITTLDQGVFYIPSVDFQYADLGSLGAHDIRKLEGIGDYLMASSLGGEIYLLKKGKLLRKYALPEFARYGDYIRDILPLPDQNKFLLSPQISTLKSVNLTDYEMKEGYPDRKIIGKGLGRASSGGVWVVKHDLSLQTADSSHTLFRFGETCGTIFEDRFGTLWISGDKGVSTFRDGVHTKLWEKDSLMANSVNVFVELKDGTLLMGSQGQGLVAARDGKTFRFPGYEASSGRAINDIYLGNDHMIWLGTNRGLTLLTKTDDGWKTLNISSMDGFPSGEVRVLHMVEAIIWAGTSKGLISFDFQSLFAQGPDAPIYLQEMRLNGKHVDHQEKEHHFGYRENTIDFDFHAISYRQMGHLNYRYQLEGLENSEVISPGTHVQYNNLDAGDYRFVVETSRPDGKWSTPVTLAVFHIGPPWWERLWFIVGCIVLGTLLLSYVVNRRVMWVKKREQAQTRMYELEKKALQAQMNPHFIFNSLNAVQGYMSGNETDLAEEYLADFSRLIRLILENSRSSSVEFSQELELLEKYTAFEALRFGGRVRFEFDVDPKLRGRQFMLAPMLLQPFVENAVVHGLANKEGQGMVKLRFELKGKDLFCTIEDNGIGREKSAAYRPSSPGKTSAGMMITRERLQLLNQNLPLNLILKITDLLDDQGLPVGTRVEVRIPFKPNLKP